MTGKVVNRGISPELFDNIVNNNARSPLYQLLKLNLLEVGPGSSRIHLKVEEQHINHWQTLHGGIIGIMVDAAMGAVVRSLGIRGVTIDRITHFLQPAHVGDHVVAEAHVVSAGRKVIIVDASVFKNGGEQIATARSTFYNTGRLLEE